MSRRIKTIVVAVIISFFCLSSLTACGGRSNMKPGEKNLSYSQLKSIVRVDKWTSTNAVFNDKIFSDWTNKKVEKKFKREETKKDLFIVDEYCESKDIVYIKGNNDIVLQECFAEEVFSYNEEKNESMERYTFFSKEYDMEFSYSAKQFSNDLTSQYIAFHEDNYASDYDSFIEWFSVPAITDNSLIKNIIQIVREDGSFSVEIIIDMDKMFEYYDQEIANGVKQYAQDIGFEIKNTVCFEFNKNKKCESVSIVSQRLNLDYRGYENGMYYSRWCEEIVFEKYNESITEPEWFDVNNYGPSEKDYSKTAGQYELFMVDLTIGGKSYSSGAIIDGKHYGSFIIGDDGKVSGYGSTTPTISLSDVLKYGYIDLVSFNLYIDGTGVGKDSNNNTADFSWEILLSGQVKITVGNKSAVFWGLSNRFGVPNIYQTYFDEKINLTNYTTATVSYRKI